MKNPSLIPPPLTTRRQLVRGFASAAAPGILRAQAPGKPMNVLLVICDQMRGDALGFLGSPNARTDRMAMEAELAALREVLEAVVFAIELEMRPVPSLKGSKAAWTELLATARPAL